MEIRKIKDVNEIVKIFVETFNGEPWNELWTEESAYNKLFELFNFTNFYGLVAVENNQPLGALLGNIRTYDKRKSLYLEEMFVVSNMRRKGIGSRLYLAAKEELKQMGVSGAFFTTIKNTQAYHFYLKHGAIDLETGSVMFHVF
ncbi:MAG: GNAT family N-acetyltransferase [Acholeplasmataceae bacterium]|jgi:aminoglycoside 6'-N-acetyltransferase I